MGIGMTFPDPVVRSLIVPRRPFCPRRSSTIRIGGSTRSPAGPVAQIAAQERVEYMVLPAAVDAQILAGIALFAEAELLQQAAAGRIVRQAGGLDAVQAEPVEHEQHERAQRLGH